MYTQSLNSGLGRCGNCEFWLRYTEQFEVKHHGQHAGICESDQFVYNNMGSTPKDGLRYWDYEGYDAGFDTGENFGCVHFKERMNKDSDDQD